MGVDNNTLFIVFMSVAPENSLRGLADMSHASRDFES